MAGLHYDLVTSLPSLGKLGTPPPITPAKMLEVIDHVGSVVPVIEAFFLADDLIQREAMMAGEIEDAEPIILTKEQLTDHAPLPEYLVPEATPDQPNRSVTDGVWDAYFHHLDRISAKTPFARKWVGYEVSLRNALVHRRAKTLEISADPYLVAVDLQESEYNFDALLSEWASVDNLLEATKLLDQARWRWIEKNDAWFTFTDDELVAYTARLILLHRWHRITSGATAAEEDSSENL